MAQPFLVQDDLRSGGLMLPFEQRVYMGDHTYYLVQPAGRAESVPMQRFRALAARQFRPGLRLRRHARAASARG